MEVGQKLYVCTVPGFISGEVIKITPSGMCDVKLLPGGSVWRFRKDGRRHGSGFRAPRLDTEMPFEQRTEWVADAKARQQIVSRIRDIEIPSFNMWNSIPDWHEVRDKFAEFEAKVKAVRTLLDEVAR